MQKNSYIAILTDEYIDYRKVIVDHITEYMRDAGYGTVCVAGRELKPVSDYHQAYDVCNQIFPLMAQAPVAGIVCLSGAIGQNVSSLELSEFVSGYAAPVVSFGLELGGVPGVVVDDSQGMTQLMEHMLSDPDRRRFVFIRGTANDTYSLQREQIFRRLLTLHGRDLNECVFLEGNYHVVDTYNAVRTLLSEHQYAVDAIVAANDIMALSAARAVNASGLRIPQDILVSGFDDTQEATRNAPALTTVRQPLVKMAELIARLLLDQITDQKANKLEIARSPVVSSEVVIRGSTVVLAKDSDARETYDALWLSKQLTSLMTGLSAPNEFDLQRCCSALWETLSTGSQSIEYYLQGMLNEQLRTVDSHWWSNLCHQLEKLSFQILSPENQREHKAIVTAALAKVRERIWAANMDQAFEVQRLQSLHTRMQAEMSSCSELVDIVATMGRWLESVGARRCFLVRYSEPSFDVCATAELIHSYRDGQTQARPDEIFSTRYLLPPSLTEELNTGLLVLNPIYAGNDQFGYLLLDPDGIDRLQIDGAAHAIGNAMRNQHLIQTLQSKSTDLQKVNTNLAHLANHDVLTGLPNRLQFQKYLGEHCDSALQTSTKLAVFFIDLDGFKSVNDTYGHGAGDLLLQQVSARLFEVLKATVGDRGFVARLGGDEFTIVLDLSEDRAMADTLGRRLLESLAFGYRLEQHTVHLSASIGCACFPDHGQTADALLNSADKAMYCAKEAGKNRFVVYQPEIDCGAPRTDQDILQALENGDMRMHYQPRVDLQSGELCAVEALMRWIAGEPGSESVVMMPDQFIPIAEDTGAICQLDNFALNQSCQLARQWELAGTPLCISVNVSVITLQQKNFLDSVQQTISKHEVDPSLIEIEITETAAMTDVENSIAVLGCLSDMGVQLSIDDFGTGYSSLNYLKRLPANNLKIDKSFVVDIDVNADYSTDNAIVRAVVALGKSMKFGLVAEGIETSEQAAFVKSLGCDQAQGYYFGKPVAECDISALLAAASSHNRAA